ncbi:MAG: S9 family peptidase [Archangium sp.]|nr:S9 family peptidase [Archangium sp.]
MRFALLLTCLAFLACPKPETTEPSAPTGPSPTKPTEKTTPTAPVAANADDAGKAAPKAVPTTYADGSPIAPKKPHVRELHGDTFNDEYFWLREKGNKEVEAYLNAEEKFAQDKLLEPLEPFIKTLYGEIVAHVAEDDSTPPVKDGAYEYWRSVAAGKEHPIFIRRKLPKGADETVIDVNALAEGKKYLKVGVVEISDDAKLALFSTDETGFREYVLQVKDLATGTVLPDRLEHAETAQWAADNKTIWYAVEDAAKRPYKVLRHVLGTDPKNDVVVYEEKDERFNLYVTRSSTKKWVFITSSSQLASEVRILDAAKPEADAIVVEPRSTEHEYELDDDGKEFLIRTNDGGRNFRIATAPFAKPGRSNWKQLVAHDPDVMITSASAFKGQLVLEVRRKGLSELDVIDRRSNKRTTIPVSEAVHTIWVDDNPEFDSKTMLYKVTSFTTPGTWYRWDFAKKKSTLVKEMPVPGGYDRAQYETARVEAKAKDGTLIPISIVSKKGTPKEAPLWLTAYGSYGTSFDTEFDPTLFPLLDRGVVYAIAHIRGGGELGKAWHENGRLAKKMNSFTDFIDATKFLVAEKWAKSDRVLIQGASAGGLLMGAVTNLEPELFKAVICDVPFVDVINTMSDPTLPLTVTEFEEWGNPAKKEEYDWLKAYSPYDNLAARAYPTMLVRSSYNDSQVMYFEPAKYVARLRSLKTDANPLYFHIEMQPAGHSGKSGRYERFQEDAQAQAFGLTQLGIAK